MENCKVASTTMEVGLKLSTTSNSISYLVGSLIYPIATRLELSFTDSYISRFMRTPKVDP